MKSALLLSLFAWFKALFTKHTVKSRGTAFQPIATSIRNPKDPIKKAAIERRRKAKKLHSLNKHKRRAVYYYNKRHPLAKMYA
jgi:hypothetical protein